MKKTVIVDDDYLVRSYLKMLSAWDKAGFTVTADVRDGEEALHALKETDADLLITDLSMPLMDGIELIRRIRQTNEGLYIIVLSCHDDFDHVKEAMREGADEYVLKNTLDDDSLFSLLASTEKKMAEKRAKKKVPSREERDTDGKQDLKYLFFNGLLSGSLIGEERERERERAGILGRYQNSAVLNLFLEAWETQEERFSHLEMEQYCQNFYHRLSDEMKHMLKEASYTEAIYLGAGVFCCFLELSDLHRSSSMRQRLTDVAAACYKICKSEPYPYKIGVSNVCIGPESVKDAFLQAREMMKFSFYDDDEILYYDRNKKSGVKLPVQAEQLLVRYTAFTCNGDEEGLFNACREVCEAFNREMTERRLALQWVKAFEQRTGLAAEEDGDKIYHISKLKQRLEQDVKKVFLADTISIPREVSKGVKIAAEFVLSHYKEDIGLNEAAKEAGMNAAYLSYLFKQELKVGFANYLLERRMDCARKLFADTNLKVREVAEKSGFRDYHYFAKTFKKMNGVSPAEYRKNGES